MALHITLVRSLFHSSFSFIRPYSPRIIPILVYVSFLPLISIISFFSGWFIWHSLAASWEVSLYMQYGDGVPPYAIVSLPDLIGSQSYAISLHLVAPTTESNLGLGNFMASVVLSSVSNRTLSSSRRASIVLPSDRTSFFRRKDTVDIHIPLIPSFTPTVSKVLAKVEVGRCDGWTSLGSGEGRELSLISAQLRGIAIPRGIRGIAMRFPLTVSLFSGAIFFMVLSSTVGLCILPKVLPYPFVKKEFEEKAAVALEPDVEGVEKDVKVDEVKTEVPDVAISKSSEAYQPTIRRRRSNRFQDSSDSDN